MLQKKLQETRANQPIGLLDEHVNHYFCLSCTWTIGTSFFPLGKSL